MKQVKSKITGDIGELDLKEGVFIVVCYDLNTKETVKSYYKSLEDLCDEWKDYEELETFWFIDEEGIIRDTTDENWSEESVGAAKSIGNYFETKEEAEKAVEKLKAWKRLRDKGFKFSFWQTNGSLSSIWFDMPKRAEVIDDDTPGDVRDDYAEDDIKDLDLLFGGKA